jgi:hypothetical protein
MGRRNRTHRIGTRLFRDYGLAFEEFSFANAEAQTFSADFLWTATTNA